MRRMRMRGLSAATMFRVARRAPDQRIPASLLPESGLLPGADRSGEGRAVQWPTLSVSARPPVTALVSGGVMMTPPARVQGSRLACGEHVDGAGCSRTRTGDAGNGRRAGHQRMSTGLNGSILQRMKQVSTPADCQPRMRLRQQHWQLLRLPCPLALPAGAWRWSGRHTAVCIIRWLPPGSP